MFDKHWKLQKFVLKPVNLHDGKTSFQVQIIPEMDKTKFYTGRVTFISSAAEQINNETMIAVKISIDSLDELLKPNSNVKVKILSE